MTVGSRRAAADGYWLSRAGQRCVSWTGASFTCNLSLPFCGPPNAHDINSKVLMFKSHEVKAGVDPDKCAWAGK